MTEPLPHAALMDRVYRHQRHVYDLTRRAVLIGRDRMIAGLDAGPGTRVVEVACGTGRNLLRLARRYPGARLHGFDISPAMLETAAAACRRAGLDGRIALARADAATADPAALFGLSAADRIVMSYCLSMIPDWRAAMAAAGAALAPGGSLWIVDFGDQSGWPGWAGRLVGAWVGMFHVTLRPDLPQAARALAAELGGRAEVTPLARGFAVLIRVTAPGAALLPDGGTGAYGAGTA